MNQNRFKTRASVHVLFLKEDSILLLLRKNITSDGLYSLVAGHLDGGETVTEATIREAKEEAGVDIDPKDIEIRTVCHSYSQHNDREFIQFYAVCKKWQGEIKNNEPDKCGDLKFFPIDSLPENIVPYIKDGIDKTLAGINFYEYGWTEKEK
jgi:8-oxo-dGTP diphosphatase